MTKRTFVAIVTAFFVVPALFVGLSALPANAQDAMGAKVKGLVTSLGGFGGWGKITTNLFISGSTVELAPGGQSGRERFLVPTFIYVIEGTLTAEYDPGPGLKEGDPRALAHPVAHGGIQYFAAGQSHMDKKSIWHNFKNASRSKPVKYLVLHVAYPGAKTVQKPE